MGIDSLMSFGLAKGRELSDAGVGVTGSELVPLPDDAASNPEAGRVDVRGWFPDPSRPLEIEIGSGKGTFLLQQAGQTADVNYLGIEWAREFYMYAADRIRRAGLKNVRMLHADATEFFKWRAPSGAARVVHLYFPDPWPKTRHHRRRSVQEPFLREVHRVLGEGGELRVVTDHAEYWAWMEVEFAKVENAGLFAREEFARPESAAAGEIVGTNFERKYRVEGRPFHAAVLRRR